MHEVMEQIIDCLKENCDGYLSKCPDIEGALICNKCYNLFCIIAISYETTEEVKRNDRKTEEKEI